MLLTTKKLKIKNGDDITFLFKGQEPFTGDSKGNPLGVLIERDNKVKCYECGGWYESLATHCRLAHKMTAKDYKIKYGFNLGAGICSKRISKMYRDRAIKNNFANYGRKNLIPGAGKRKGKPMSMQQKNATGKGPEIKGTCPEQIKGRLARMIAKYGKSFTKENCYEAQESGIVSWAISQYGSFNKMKLKNNLDINIVGLKNEADLIYDLRIYVGNNETVPFKEVGGVDTVLDGFPHSRSAYVKRWGSWRKAMQSCGVIKSSRIKRSVFKYTLIN